MAGGVIGYDFVGPRVELEGIYRWNGTNVGLPGTALNNQVGQLGIMANLMYDFMPASVITPYIGAGAGLGLVDSNTLAGQHGVCLSGHRRPGLDRRHELPREPRWPLLRHVEPDGERRPVDQQQLQRDAGSAAEVRLGSAAAAGSGAAGCAAVVHGVLRLGPLEPLAAGADHDQDRPRRRSRARAMPASRRPATPTRRARKPTTWRCRCVVPTRSRTPWCVTACRRRRSR